MMIIYCMVGLVAGILSEKLMLSVKVLVVITGVLWAVVLNSWPYIDWKAGTAMSTLWSGVYSYSFPALLFFGAPFLLGVYLSRGLRTALSRKAR